MRVRMSKNKHQKPMMEEHRLWRTEGILDVIWEPVMSKGLRASVAMMRMQMRRNKHFKPMMDQHRMWRTKGIVLQTVKIGLYISDL